MLQKVSFLTYDIINRLSNKSFYICIQKYMPMQQMLTILKRTCFCQTALSPTMDEVVSGLGSLTFNNSLW